MKRVLFLTAALFAAPVFAQTATESEADTNLDMQGQFAPFYTDDTMGTARSQDEITTYWGTLSADDQSALKARCTTGMMTSGGGDGSADAAGTEGGTEGADTGTGDSMELTDSSLQPVCDSRWP